MIEYPHIGYRVGLQVAQAPSTHQSLSASTKRVPVWEARWIGHPPSIDLCGDGQPERIAPLRTHAGFALKVQMSSGPTGSFVVGGDALGDSTGLSWRKIRLDDQGGRGLAVQLPASHVTGRGHGRVLVFDHLGTLRFESSPPVGWAFGREIQPTTDHDGDGVADYLFSAARRTAAGQWALGSALVSGADGRWLRATRYSTPVIQAVLRSGRALYSPLDWNSNSSVTVRDALAAIDLLGSVVPPGSPGDTDADGEIGPFDVLDIVGAVSAQSISLDSRTILNGCGTFLAPPPSRRSGMRLARSPMASSKTWRLALQTSDGRRLFSHRIHSPIRAHSAKKFTAA